MDIVYYLAAGLFGLGTLGAAAKAESDGQEFLTVLIGAVYIGLLVHAGTVIS